MSRSKVGLKTLEALEASLFCNAILESVFESFIAVAKSEVAGRCLSVHEVSVMELEVSRRHLFPHYQYNDLTLSAAIFPSPNSRLRADAKHVRPRIRIRSKRGRASSFEPPFEIDSRLSARRTLPDFGPPTNRSAMSIADSAGLGDRKRSSDSRGHLELGSS